MAEGRYKEPFKGNTKSYCSAFGCSNNKRDQPHLSFHRFPKPSEKERCKIWLRRSRRADLQKKSFVYLRENCRMCTEHFDDNMFMNPLKNKLVWNAIPNDVIHGTKQKPMPSIETVAHDHIGYISSMGPSTSADGKETDTEENDVPMDPVSSSDENEPVQGNINGHRKKGVKRKSKESIYLKPRVFDPIIRELPEHLTYRYGIDGEEHFIVIMRRTADVTRANGGPLNGARITIYDNGESYFNVHGTPREDILENCLENKEALEQLIGRLGKWYHYCGGIPKDVYENSSPNVPNRPQLYKERSVPFPAVVSKKCERWFHSKQPRVFDNGQKCCAKCTTFLRNTRKKERKNQLCLQNNEDLSVDE